MNKKLLERLSKNPHYRMSTEQKRELAEVIRPEMIQFGKPDIHTNTFAKHDVSMIKQVYEKTKTPKQLPNKPKLNKR